MVDVDEADEEEDANKLSRPDLLLKLRVEQLVGKKGTRQMPNLAVHRRVAGDKLSLAAIMDMLRSLDC